jgi:hypothetical protein
VSTATALLTWSSLVVVISDSIKGVDNFSYSIFVHLRSTNLLAIALFIYLMETKVEGKK